MRSRPEAEAGASVDTLIVGPSPGNLDDAEDTELDEAVPNAERLIAEAVRLAAAAGQGAPTARRTSDLSAAAPAAIDAAADGTATAAVGPEPAGEQPSRDPMLPDLVQQYWRLVPDEELVGRRAQDLVDATAAHRELAEQRLPGELKLRISTPPDGLHTAVEIVTDDMPFLVDSVAGALAARNLDIHQLVHPQVVLRREALGRLIEIFPGVEPDDARPGDIVESWIRVETDRLRDQATIDKVRNDLQSVLTDVREAVEDWPRMRVQALTLADELAAADLPVPDKDISDSVELLRWLADDHFTFLGYREYDLIVGDGGQSMLKAKLGTGLGVLRQDQVAPRVLSTMTPEAYEKVLEKRLLIITKANARSTVHRNAYLDYVGFKVFDEDGNVTGERRFLGLFSTAAYRTSVRELPVVRRKVAEVIARSGLSPRSHSGKDLLEILETYPRDELFQIKTDDLFQAVIGVLRMAGRRQLRLFLRRDGYGRFISCLIYLPRDRFTTANRLKIQEILIRELNGIGVDYTTRVSESMLARLHYIVRTDPTNPPGRIDPDDLAEQLADATRLWDDDFRLVLERKLGEEQAKQLLHRYGDALPETYKDEHTPYEAAKDLAKLELLEEPGQLEMHLFRRRKDDSDVRFKVFRYGEPMVLSAVLPVLHSLGVRVTDERPFEIRRTDGSVYLYDFGLRLPDGSRDSTEVRPRVENAFSATWRGEAEVDGFNELVVRAGLTWRQVVILRAYAKYLRQAGTVFSQEYMEQTFITYPTIATLLVQLFETRFDPRISLSDEDRSLQAKELVSAIGRELDAVTSLDQDRILRSYLTLVQATLRTSFFQRGPDGRPKSYAAFKLDPQAVPELPAPRPQFEIFVYSPRFEGVHLRFGPVARGGIRWSDRREDFRTEILGLVKAQMVKNAVIVPVGAKGGFVLKRTASNDREEGEACYKLLISALLDVTDNLVGGKVDPPEDVIRHDVDDTYLVVAADKGTATFSDLANEISKGRGYWLGDAFASGGSAGYDHKKMGITARGAWESVKRHFRQLNMDIQRQDFTAVGIGDMSGDVFGNGALLSEHMRLIAAFDHRHIFIDPTPDAASSYVERKRLFDMPRSSWDDYDRALISAGGGVWERTAKKVEISPEIRLALGLPDGATSMSPQELMKSILQAPVDLLWNGGIGTYVKASDESHAEVGDKSTDAIRVNGDQVRARVIGEGGNLGMTQRGRIEYAMCGGLVFADFIDNSAGVDCSDHEVNIKILLGGPINDGQLSMEDRDELLVQMTDEVAELCLRDNYDQARALGNALLQARPLLPVHRRMITELERSGRLERTLESLPTDEELTARAEAGKGLTQPELAVLLAYVKIALEDEVVSSSLADDAWTQDVLRDYFPHPLTERFADRMAGHALRRDIVATSLVNEAINRGGISFVFRVVEETDASPADVLRAYVIAREVYGLRELWLAVEALDGEVDAAAQTAVYLDSRRLLDRMVRWLLQNRRAPLDVEAEIARLKPGVTRLLPDLGTLFRGAERESLRAHIAAMLERGIPEQTADWATRVMYGFGLIDIVEVAQGRGRDVAEVAGLYYVLSEHFRVDDLLSKISLLPREDRWQTLARMALRYDLYAALAALTGEVLASTSQGSTPEDRVTEWERVNEASIARVRKAIGEFQDSHADLAALSVLLRQIRTLVRTSAAA